MFAGSVLLVIDADNAPDVLSADFSAGSQGLKARKKRGGSRQ
jgi:hypothetical protein